MSQKQWTVTWRQVFDLRMSTEVSAATETAAILKARKIASETNDPTMMDAVIDDVCACDEPDDFVANEGWES